ncbi:MAG: glycosyltransferase family 2 protein [Nitrospinota bacterium]
MYKKILAIVPAYNEEDSVTAVIDDIKMHLPEADIVVINDASTDGTANAVRSRNGVRLIDLPINLGIGGAVQTGFRYALNGSYDIAVQIDGDGQHMASEVKKVLTPVIDDVADMSIGSRYLEKKGFFEQKVLIGLRMKELISEETIKLIQSWQHTGFHVHHETRIPAYSLQGQVSAGDTKTRSYAENDGQH